MNELVAEDVWLKALLQGAPFLDVRSPNEFQAGALPDAINIPLLNNEEFHLVGLTYKEKGPAEALAQGHRLVQGESKNSRVRSGKSFL